MRKDLARRSRIMPKRIAAEILAFVQVFLLLPSYSPVDVLAAGMWNIYE